MCEGRWEVVMEDINAYECAGTEGDIRDPDLCDSLPYFFEIASLTNLELIYLLVITSDTLVFTCHSACVI